MKYLLKQILNFKVSIVLVVLIILFRNEYVVYVSLFGILALYNTFVWFYNKNQEYKHDMKLYYIKRLKELKSFTYDENDIKKLAYSYYDENICDDPTKNWIRAEQHYKNLMILNLNNIKNYEEIVNKINIKLLSN